MEKEDEAEKIPLLERAFKLIEWFPQEGAGFGEVRDLFPGVPPSTVSRLLKALMAEDVLCRSESGGYELSGRIKRIARRIISVAPRHEVVRPVLTELAQKLGESAAYFEPVENGIVLLAKCEMPEAFHYMDEGGVNRNLKRHGFNLLLHGGKKGEVFTNLKDDKALLVRVAAEVRVKDRVVGAMGVSFFSSGMEKSERVLIENTVLDAAREAGQRIQIGENK